MKQHKKKRNTKSRRIVYKYNCCGCGKRRMSFDYERAKREECKVCEPKGVAREQTSIFDLLGTEENIPNTTDTTE